MCKDKVYKEEDERIDDVAQAVRGVVWLYGERTSGMSRAYLILLYIYKAPLAAYIFLCLL